MGSGKTTVGKMLAQELNRPFVDMDEHISKCQGKPVEKIFLEDGEATFRELEAELLGSLCQQNNLVIATGGGTLVDPGNLLFLKSSGCLICLKADVDVILDRVQKNTQWVRPLLDDRDIKKKNYPIVERTRI